MPCRSPSVLPQCEAMGFYCPCQMGATTGLDVVTKLSPISKGAAAVCVLWLGDMLKFFNRPKSANNRRLTIYSIYPPNPLTLIKLHTFKLDRNKK